MNKWLTKSIELANNQSYYDFLEDIYPFKPFDIRWINPKYKDQRVIAGNYSFKNLEDGLITLCKKESKNNNHSTLVINDNVIRKFEDQLNKILNNIISNDFIQTSDKEVCKWCDYKLICNR